jgi:hypothetical protein
MRGNHVIVDRLFAAAELRLGDGGSERRVRIMRTEGRPSGRDRDLAADLRLRPERPPVTRLSLRVLMGLATVAEIAVPDALIWAGPTGPVIGS